MIDPTREASWPEAPPIVINGRSLRAPKQFVAGTHRCVSPDETWEFIRPRLRRAGITRVADLTGLDRVGVTTATAVRPNARSLSNSAGKGFTRIAAVVSAAMEALELHHAEFPQLDYTVDTYDELSAAAPVYEFERMAFSRSSLFKRDRPEAWVRGWDLLQNRETYLPWVSATMTQRPNPQPSMEASMPMTSNGLASGNHLLEATCAALYEVIERDAVACQMNAEVIAKYRAPLVPLESLGFPFVDELLARFRAAGLRVVVRDCTTDTEVPVYTAYLFDERTRGFGAFAGWGAHLDPEIAMIRAITEAAQARVIYISGSRDDLFRLDERQARYEDNPVQVAKKTAPGLRDAPRRTSEAGSSFEADLTRLLDKLRHVGIRQVLVVDLTVDAFQIPVVRVVVPGLEGYIGHDYVGGERARAAVARGRRLMEGVVQ